MAKLKNIIKQLSENDYESIYNSLNEGNADKSAYLLKSMREKRHSDTKIMSELAVNTNAYYTLRSRLNQKIEEYLLKQLASPRADVLKKVANLNELMFTKRRAVAIATLKRLEKELLDYDLSNELTIVYKCLKKLHINTPDHFHYSQLYNKHVAYMLAVDKAEYLLTEYFKKYGDYTMVGDEHEKLELGLLVKEMSNLTHLYHSHRLYVYQSCMIIFHRLFVEEGKIKSKIEPTEDIFEKIQTILNSYYRDSIYYHLNLVFEFLKLEYYEHYKVYRKAERHFEEVNEDVDNLVSNYSLYTYSPQFLLTKIKRHIRMGRESELYTENDNLFREFKVDKHNVPQFITYSTYRSISCYYSGKYDEGARWLNNLLNEINLKRYPLANLEVKAILTLQYCMMNDYNLFNQLVKSIQRQTRLLGKENCEHIVFFVKILKLAMSDIKKYKYDKINELVTIFSNFTANYFYPTMCIKMDNNFINKLSFER